MSSYSVSRVRQQEAGDDRDRHDEHREHDVGGVVNVGRGEVEDEVAGVVLWQELERGCVFVLTQTGIERVTAGGAVPYLNLFAVTAGGWVLAKEALAAQQRLAGREGDPAFNEAKLLGARFYAEQFLAPAAASLPAITGGGTVLAIPVEAL